MNSKILILCFIAAFMITGCASVPISSMWKLYKLEVEDIDPEHLKIAVIADRNTSLVDGSVTLTSGFTPRQMADKSHYFSRIIPATVIEGAEVEQLLKQVDENQTITLFHFDAEQAELMRRSFNRIRMTRDQEIDGYASFKFDVDTACLPTPRPEQLLATVYVKYKANQNYFLINRDVDLLEIDRISEDKKYWRNCEPKSPPVSGENQAEHS